MPVRIYLVIENAWYFKSIGESIDRTWTFVKSKVRETYSFPIVTDLAVLVIFVCADNLIEIKQQQIIKILLVIMMPGFSI